MKQYFRNISHSTQRYIAAFSLLFLFAACNQTPTPNNPDPNNITGMQVENEDGTLSLAAATTQGLTGDYFDNMDFTGTKKTQIDATINKTWNNNSPVTGIAKTTYSVRWTGQIQPQYTQKYTFYVTSSDGARLMVNGQALVNDWKDGVNRVRSGTVDLIANTKYDIRLEYYRNATNAGAVKLEWQSTSRTRQVVPQAKLYPTGSDVLTAIQILNALPSLQSKNLRFDFLTTSVIRTPDRFKISATDVDGNDFLVSEIKDQKVSFILQYAQSNATGKISELISGLSADLGDMTTFINGTATNADSFSLMKKIANFNANFGGSTISVSSSTNTVRPQYLVDFFGCDWLPPPPPCAGNCDAKANDFRDLTCQLSAAVTEWILALAPIPAGKIQKFFDGSRIAFTWVFGGAAPFDVAVLWNKRIQAWQDYLQCLKDNADKGCQPDLIVTPQSISLRKKLNSSGVIDPRVVFENSSSSKGTLSLQWTSFGDDRISGISNGNSNLAPGQTIPFILFWSCPSIPAILHKTITLTHNARNLASPFEILIRIECADEAKIAATTTPMTAPITKSTSGSITVTNPDGTIDLLISSIGSFVPDPAFNLSGASVTVDNRIPAAIAPNSSGYNIPITGNCGSTVGILKGTITISSNATNAPTLSVGVTLQCVGGNVLTIPVAVWVGSVKCNFVDNTRTKGHIFTGNSILGFTDRLEGLAEPVSSANWEYIENVTEDIYEDIYPDGCIWDRNPLNLVNRGNWLAAKISKVLKLWNDRNISSGYMLVNGRIDPFPTYIIADRIPRI